jgi:hypothetical protein
MTQMTEIPHSSWFRLRGKIADAVFVAPNIPMGTDWRRGTIADEIAEYVAESVVSTPWADYLALVATVLSMRGLTVNSIFAVLWSLNPRLKSFFEALGLRTMKEWNAEQQIPAYLKGELLPDHSSSMRLTFWHRYSSASRNVAEWIDALPVHDRQTYQQFALPIIDIPNATTLIMVHSQLRQQQQLREREIEGLIPTLTALRAAAHMRYNQLTRLLQAYEDALETVERDGLSLPVSFSYEESIIGDHRTPTMFLDVLR